MVNKSNNQVPLMLSVPLEVRDKLRTMAAERNLQNPSQVSSAAQISREILCEHLAKLTVSGEADRCEAIS